MIAKTKLQVKVDKQGHGENSGCHGSVPRLATAKDEHAVIQGEEMGSLFVLLLYVTVKRGWACMQWIQILQMSILS